MKTARFSLVAVVLATAALCGCSSDTETATTPAEPNLAATNVNAVCPYSGKPVNASVQSVAYKGKTYGFCCAGCASDFAGRDDAKKAEIIAKMAAK